ncbi:MAG: YdcF family protein [Terriglobales bacterium]
MKYPPNGHLSTAPNDRLATSESSSAHATTEPLVRRGYRMGRWIAGLAAVAGLGAAGFVGATAIAVVRQAPRDETRRAGAIIVFGAAEYSGRPSPVFRARLDHAYDLFQRGIAPLVITTGSGARDPKYTEGGVGHDYLRRRGIPDVNLVAETQSDDTSDSAHRTATILRANRIQDCVAVSDAYHMLRVKRLLQEQGVTVYASPRPDSIPHTRRARIVTAAREALSYLAYKIGLN